MRCACIDIGSNTTRLLVADVVRGQLAAVVQQRSFTRIGRAIAVDGVIPAALIGDIVDVVAKQREVAAVAGAGHLRVVATAAIRRAENRDELLTALRERAAVEVAVVPGDDEARLAFAGATCALAEAPDGPVAVVDVGGGSAQVVVGTCDDGPSWSVSLPLGSGDLTAAHLHGDPPGADELACLRGVVDETLAAISPPPVTRALAVGGSATSLRRLAGPELSPAPLEHALATLLAAPSAQLAGRLRIAPERARLLPAGILVLTAVARQMGPLEVARGGLREGVLRELAAAS
jgi:exopolyphosphatase / guanosine-5'-triphosphate,3'-diphosphate pyrophosphatase